MPSRTQGLGWCSRWNRGKAPAVEQPAGSDVTREDQSSSNLAEPPCPAAPTSHRHPWSSTRTLPVQPWLGPGSTGVSPGSCGPQTPPATFQKEKEKVLL